MHCSWTGTIQIPFTGLRLLYLSRRVESFPAPRCAGMDLMLSRGAGGTFSIQPTWQDRGYPDPPQVSIMGMICHGRLRKRKGFKIKGFQLRGNVETLLLVSSTAWRHSSLKVYLRRTTVTTRTKPKRKEKKKKKIFFLFFCNCLTFSSFFLYKLFIHNA